MTAGDRKKTALEVGADEERALVPVVFGEIACFLCVSSQGILALVLGYILVAKLMFNYPGLVRAKEVGEIIPECRHLWPWLVQFRELLPLMQFPILAWFAFGLVGIFLPKCRVSLWRFFLVSASLIGAGLLIVLVYAGLGLE